MKIAVIGWGSLIWNPRSLATSGGWREDGPELPVEFCRVSRNRCLTLVLADGIAPPQPVLWTHSPLKDLEAARDDLRRREGSKGADIHAVSRSGMKVGGILPAISDRINGWLESHGLDAAVWTGLPPSLDRESLSRGAAVEYLRTLCASDPEAAALARGYVVNAPQQIRTPIREMIERELQWTPRISRACRDSLYNFVGYGGPEPRFILVGPEEASEGDLLNLEVRCRRFPGPWHDRSSAVLELAQEYAARGHPNAKTYAGALKPGAEPTWTFASKFIAAVRGGATWEEEYARLGAAGGDSLLTELFPLPKPGTGSWPTDYRAEFGFADQDQYYESTWPRHALPGTGTSRRADVLHEALNPARWSDSTVVLGYGRGAGGEFWERFSRLVGVTDYWKSLEKDVAEVARHPSGAVLVRTAHPSRNMITASLIPRILDEIGRLSLGAPACI